MSADKPVNKTDENVYRIDTPKLGTGEIKPDPSKDTAHLLVGFVLESSDLFLNWLEGRNAGTIAPSDEGEPAKSDAHQFRDFAIGLGYRSAKSTQENLQTAARISNRMAEAFSVPVKAILRSAPFRPIRAGFDSLVDRGKAEVDDWARLGAEEENRSREFARETASNMVDDVIRFLSKSPALNDLIGSQIDQMASDLSQTTQIDVLVRVLANNYIQYLSDNPEQVQELIQTQGDNYLGYLEQNPEQIQELVQGQGGSLIDVLTDQVREFTVTADDTLELLARKLFRRTLRTEVPEPPPEVLVRAANPRYFEKPQLQQSENNDLDDSSETK